MKKFLMCLIASAALVALLAPSAMAVGTPAGTVIENQAFADYKDANGNARPRVFSNTVSTTVSQVAGVSVTPETASKTGIAGSEVYFGATICNTGNGPDTINLALSGNIWSAVIYLDDNGDGIWDPLTETTVVSDTGVLAADECFKVIVVVSIPPGAADGDSDSVVLTGTSQFDPVVAATGTYATTSESAVFENIKSVSPAGPQPPGTVLTYTVNNINIGSADTEDVRMEDFIPAGTNYVPGSLRIGVPAGTSYEDSTPMADDGSTEYINFGAYYDSVENKVVFTKETCLAGGSRAFHFQVIINEGVLEGTPISNQATITYRHVGLPTVYTSISNSAVTSVGPFVDIDLDPNRIGTGNPGDQIVYAFTATNNGNAADRINITRSLTGGWNWVIWVDVDGDGMPGTDGDYILTDTNGDGIIDTGILTPNGGTIHLLAVATIPAGLSDGTVDITTVTGTSVRDNTVTDFITLTTTVTAPLLGITKSVSPEGPQPPGTVLTYTVTVTNNGSGNATSVIITDFVPAFTTYQAGSLKTGSTIGTLVSRTDANDGDGAYFFAGSAITDPVTLGPGGQIILRFDVMID